VCGRCEASSHAPVAISIQASGATGTASRLKGECVSLARPFGRTRPTPCPPFMHHALALPTIALPAAVRAPRKQWERGAARANSPSGSAPRNARRAHCFHHRAGGDAHVG
jgi:hypothetical protein